MDLDGLFVEGTSIQIPRDIHIISSIDEQPMMFERIDYTNLHFEDLDEIFIMNQ